jgi:hypothetical protein
MGNVSYSAVMLDKESHDKLVKVFKPMIPNDWKVFAHHMTIKMGALPDESKAKEDMLSGVVITLNVEDYAMDDMVMAVGVSGYESQNAKSHITIATNINAGAKPVMSNKLTDWKPLGFPLQLIGKVSEIEFK